NAKPIWTTTSPRRMRRDVLLVVPLRPSSRKVTFRLTPNSWPIGTKPMRMPPPMARASVKTTTGVSPWTSDARGTRLKPTHVTPTALSRPPDDRPSPADKRETDAFGDKLPCHPPLSTAQPQASRKSGQPHARSSQNKVRDVPPANEQNKCSAAPQ